MKFSFIKYYIFIICTVAVYSRVKDDVFLDNKELAELLSQKLISRAQIMKLPCIRRNRRCFANHIKRRGWKNQKNVNKFLNEKLNITNEEKFIDDVLKLMIADNADTLRAGNDEEIHFTKALIQEQMAKSKLRKKHRRLKKRRQEKRSRNLITARSEILDIPDFINTYNLNEFNLELKPNIDPLLTNGLLKSNFYSPIKSARRYRDNIGNNNNDIERKRNSKRYEVVLNSESFQKSDDTDFLDDSAVNYQGVENTIIEKDVALVRTRNNTKPLEEDIYNDVTSTKSDDDIISTFEKGTVFDDYGTDFDMVTDDNTSPLFQINKVQPIQEEGARVQKISKLQNLKDIGNLPNVKQDGSLHNGHEIGSNTLHNGKLIGSDTLHNGHEIGSNTLHNGKLIGSDTLHNGNAIVSDTLHNGNVIVSDTLHNGNAIVSDTLHNGNVIVSDTLHNGNVMATPHVEVNKTEPALNMKSATKHLIENNTDNNSTTMYNAAIETNSVLPLNDSVKANDTFDNNSPTTQGVMFSNKSQNTTNPKTILQKLNVNIKTNDNNNLNTENRIKETSFNIEKNKVKLINNSQNTPSKNSENKVVQKPTTDSTTSSLVDYVKNQLLAKDREALKQSESRKLKESGSKTNTNSTINITTNTIPISLEKENINKSTNRNSINNETSFINNQLNNVTLLNHDEITNNETLNNRDQTFKNKNISTDIGSKRHILNNTNKNYEYDLDSDFDFEDSFDNSLENVVTVSDSEIDDGNSGNSKDDIVIESNENFVSDDKKNRSRVFKMHLKDANSLTTKNFQTVHWNFDDNFNWNDYINQYPFNVNFPTIGNLYQETFPTTHNNEPVFSEAPTNGASNVRQVPTNNVPQNISMTPSEESLQNYIITTPRPSKVQADTDYPTRNISWALDIPKGRLKATRVCKPGANKPFHPGKSNCLIIGDSIALSYSYSVAAALRDDCQVQLAPLSKAGVALDSKYGLECLDMFLSTKDLQPTYYDVVLFNFGLHDIDYLRRYPEEYNNITSYIKNLKAIKRRILETGATAAFVLSTPVTFDADKDNTLKKYNHAAKRVMEEHPHVMTVNLHKLVVKECGPIPFDNCYMMKKPNDVHYGVTGSIMLGKRIAYTIKYLLRKRKVSAQYAQHRTVMMDISHNATQCNIETHCPVSSTCMNNLVSRTGVGCCRMHRAIDCGDSWHCCPHGTVCHPACSDKACTCIK